MVHGISQSFSASSYDPCASCRWDRTLMELTGSPLSCAGARRAQNATLRMRIESPASGRAVDGTIGKTPLCVGRQKILLDWVEKGSVQVNTRADGGSTFVSGAAHSFGGGSYGSVTGAAALCNGSTTAKVVPFPGVLETSMRP
jgi:hypothetical protein